MDLFFSLGCTLQRHRMKYYRKCLEEWIKKHSSEPDFYGRYLLPLEWHECTALEDEHPNVMQYTPEYTGHLDEEHISLCGCCCSDDREALMTSTDIATSPRTTLSLAAVGRTRSEGGHEQEPEPVSIQLEQI